MATASKASPKVVPLDDAAKTAPNPNKKMLIMVLVAALVGFGGAGGAWFFLKGSSDHAEDVKETKKAKHDPGKPPVFIPIDPFTVNLQSEGIDQYLQVALTLQVAGEAEVEQIKQYMPLVRSRILLLLAGKKPSELSNTEGKEKLQQEIAELLSKPLVHKGDELDVSAVLFTSFVIQ